MGGISPERDISLMTGTAVLGALRRRGIDAHGMDAADDLARALLRERCDRVWNALHGPGGEDGAAQGLLEYLGIPYTGSGVLGSALAMDKERSKTLFAAAGLATPPSSCSRDPRTSRGAAHELGLPLAVKPAGQGSSVGVSKVERSEDCRRPTRKPCASATPCSRSAGSAAASTPHRCSRARCSR
jgi:D-alanine-D-alanine ligase